MLCSVSAALPGSIETNIENLSLKFQVWKGFPQSGADVLRRAGLQMAIQGSNFSSSSNAASSESVLSVLTVDMPEDI